MLPPGLLVHAYTQNVHCSIYSFILLLQGLSETLHFFSIMPSWKRIDSLYYYINISLATKVPELSPRDGACSPSAATIPAESLPGLRRDSRDQIQFILACSEYIYIYIYIYIQILCIYLLICAWKTNLFLMQSLRTHWNCLVKQHLPPLHLCLRFVLNRLPWSPSRCFQSIILLYAQFHQSFMKYRGHYTYI